MLGVKTTLAIELRSPDRALIALLWAGARSGSRPDGTSPPVMPALVAGIRVFFLGLLVQSRRMATKAAMTPALVVNSPRQSSQTRGSSGLDLVPSCHAKVTQSLAPRNAAHHP